MKIAVLNPGGRDPGQSFTDGAGAPRDDTHAPVNFHAFAACTGGSFHRTDETIPPDTKHVVLLARSDLKSTRQSIVELRALKKNFALTLKETGTHQIAELLRKPARLRMLRELCERADGCIATTPDTIPLYRGLGARTVEFIPTPYPVEEEAWCFAVPFEERRGIFIGTREFLVPSRNHLLALQTIRQIAEPMCEPVTVFNGDGWRGRRLLAELQWPELRVIEKPLPYPRYLRLLAQHKIVFQLDASAVPGQVAGDALLCRVPCVGGNGTTERLAFPDLTGHGRSADDLLNLAARLIEHPHDSDAVIERAVATAKNTIGFANTARELRDFFQRISR